MDLWRLKTNYSKLEVDEVKNKTLRGELEVEEYSNKDVHEFLKLFAKPYGTNEEYWQEKTIEE